MRGALGRSFVAAGAVLAVICSAGRAGGTPPSPEWLDRVIEAAGDREAVGALRGFRARGKLLPLVEGPTASVRVVVDLSGSLREDVRDPLGTTSRRLVGPLAWIGSGKPKPASGDEADAIHLRFRELTAPFELARTPPDSLEMSGKTPEGWLRVSRRGADGTGLAWDVDPETGHVRRFVEVPADGAAAPLVELEFDDYRRIDGVAWPFRATRWIRGRAAQETVWERFEPADDLSPEEFLPSSAGSGL